MTSSYSVARRRACLRRSSPNSRRSAGLRFRCAPACAASTCPTPWQSPFTRPGGSRDSHLPNDAHDLAPGMSSHARVVLRKTFGYAAFRDAQEAVVDHVVAGGDSLV